jgi:hypothetical protein
VVIGASRGDELPRSAYVIAPTALSTSTTVRH